MDAINWANNYSYDGLRNVEATRNARNLLAEEYNSQIKTGNFADKVNVASDIMGLAEKGRQFNEKINTYAQKVNRTAPLSEEERAPEEDVVEGEELEEIILGDVSQDGNVDVLDIVALVGIVLDGIGLENLSPSAGTAADYNQDGRLDILDIIMMMNLILDNGDTQLWQKLK